MGKRITIELSDGEAEDLAKHIDELRYRYHADGSFLKARWCRRFLISLRRIISGKDIR